MRLRVVAARDTRHPTQNVLRRCVAANTYLAAGLGDNRRPRVFV